MRCSNCGADLPEDARFCIECGTDLQHTPRTGETVQLPRQAEPEVPCRSCGTPNPANAVYCVRCGSRLDPAAVAPDAGTLQPLAGAPPRAGRRRGRRHTVLPGAVFLIGLGVLLLLRAPFWPTILIVVGLSAFLNEALRGRVFNALSSVLWLFGLAFLFSMPRLWWPGILVLVGLSVLLDLGRRAAGRP